MTVELSQPYLPGCEPRKNDLSSSLGKARRTSFKNLLTLVADKFEVSEEELKGPGRSRYISQPRHVLMFLGYADTLLTLPRIGTLLGLRDHTTILHGVCIIRDLEDNDDRLKKMAEIRATYWVP